MKSLLLIRHAKSSWKDPSLTDLQRPLKKRGIRNAREMAERIGELKLEIQKIISSPARRAVQTLDEMADATGFGQDSVQIMPELYSFDYDDVIVSLKTMDDLWQSVAMVGHNPAITDAVNFLALEHIGNIPTCGIALLELDIDHWTDLRAGCAPLQHYDFPKNDPHSDD